MALDGPLGAALCLLVAIAVSVELFRILPFQRQLRRLLETSRKSLHVIRSRHISEHWKEKALARYSRDTMLLSAGAVLYLILLLLAFLVVYFSAGLLFFGSFSKAEIYLYLPEYIVLATGMGVLYGLIRNKIGKRHKKNASDYPFSSRVLHRVALGSNIVKEMAFDLDSALLKTIGFREVKAPVYIAGLARAGTTILLEALHASGEFVSLIYRDMPFVTAPYLWSRLSALHRIEKEKEERAHGDRLRVNYDSPEAFEEVFWLTFARDDYVREDRLLPHGVDDELISKYRAYVGNVVSSRKDEDTRRYLAKNTNNLLRITTIRAAFPDAKIIVPFRNPREQSLSLLRQHERFMERHTVDPFSLKYMNWLGHFEFGLNFKPFGFAPGAVPENAGELRNPEYWIRYWGLVYEYVLEHHASDVVFLDYDEMCRRPAEVLRKIGELVSIDEAVLERFAVNINTPAIHSAASGQEAEPSGQVKTVYDSLRSHSI